ncbi:hypothetical protein ASF56_04095 [Methylobacterium sp. Leaf122]|uniref:Uncharacterized protein n=3 Tax=Methylorubrum extorquens TaxID=408 RepID=A0AAX3WD19_METEX|nr:hypothetical protein ASF33_01560 [Methylobacterium sp. Leaf92]KQQ17914.1 hypothetical protein ASF56_04095 [Methylobacterium sp. Leaf122]WHQ69354.1 hypothetical protein KEC54_23940 [Methylorubrum extorquens]
MSPFAGPPAMNFFAQLSVKSLLPPLAAGLASMGAVLAVSTLASAGGAERWALRPKAPPTPAAAEPGPIEPAPTLRGSKAIPVSEMPGERRTVRIVYQGYLPAEAR